MCAKKVTFFSTIFLQTLVLPTTIHANFYDLDSPFLYLTSVTNNFGGIFSNFFNNGDDPDNSSGSSSWNYNNANAWKFDYPSCGGVRQSPIDIDFSRVVNIKQGFPNLRYVGYENIPNKMTIENNGHTVEISGTWPPGMRPYIIGGGLEGQYLFQQFHFHWGNGNPNPTAGAEHTFNGRTLPLELHIVHYKRRYETIEEASNYEDGIVVIGRVFWVNGSNENGFGSFKNQIGLVNEPDSEIEIPPFPLSDFNFESDNNFLTYPGSLTTPPCSEVVTWILPTKPLSVSNDVLRRFRAVKLNGGDDQNYRAVQPLNRRQILLIQHNQNGQGPRPTWNRRLAGKNSLEKN